MVVQTKEREAPGDLIHRYKYLMEEKRIGSWTLPSVILCKDRRTGGCVFHKLKHRKFLLNMGK